MSTENFYDGQSDRAPAFIKAGTYTQLIEVAWQIIREEGTEALTLGHLAERAGITKPVVYDHFTSRSGLFAALYREYDLRSTARMDEQSQTAPVLEKLAAVIADAYIECVLLSGREMPSVIAALSGTPELEQLRQEYATRLPRSAGHCLLLSAMVIRYRHLHCGRCSVPQKGYPGR
jgi:AcrR family transcriptional regulator